jgi:acyl carrier protein
MGRQSISAVHLIFELDRILGIEIKIREFFEMRNFEELLRACVERYEKSFAGAEDGSDHSKP